MTADGQGGSAMPGIPNAAPIAELKQRLRRHARQRRAAAHRQRAVSAALALRDRVIADRAVLVDAAPVVAGYAPIAEEIDVMPTLLALLARGCACVLPAVVDRGRPLEFRVWQPDAPMQPGPFGILQPLATATVASPDLLIVPTLAFDRRGGRLGYGGGFYDRTLADLRRRRRTVLAVGVAFADQEIDEVPLDAGDQILDRIVTDRETISVAKGATA